MSRGKIITIEGLDGSFKETNAKSLCYYLQSKGIKTNLVSFPRYETATGKKIKDYLRGELKLSRDELIELYAKDRLDYMIKCNVKNRIEDGEWFIFDRYVESNLIYQTAFIENDDKCFEEMSRIMFLEYSLNELPEPDLIIILKSDLELTQTIYAKRNQETGEIDINEMDNIFMEKCFKNLDRYIDITDQPISVIKTYEYIPTTTSSNVYGLTKNCSKNKRFRDREDILKNIVSEINSIL